MVLMVFNLSGLPTFDIIILAASSSIMGVITSLLVIALSSNKVEGMAIGKLSGLVGMGMFIPAIFKGAGGYLGGVLPSFWIGKFLLDKQLIFLVAYCITGSVWMIVLLKIYERKRI